MDAIDLEIVRLLRSNGRLSQEQLARQVNLSRPAVHERLRRLRAQDVILGYTAVVNWSALGLPFMAFVWVRTAPSAKCNEVGRELIGLSNEEAVVEECHRVTGEWSMLLKTRIASPLALQRLIDRAREVPGLQSTMTILVLSTMLEGQAVAEGDY